MHVCMLAGLMVSESEAEELAQLGSLSDTASATMHDIALRTRIQPERWTAGTCYSYKCSQLLDASIAR